MHAVKWFEKELPGVKMVGFLETEQNCFHHLTLKCKSYLLSNWGENHLHHSSPPLPLSKLLSEHFKQWEGDTNDA